MLARVQYEAAFMFAYSMRERTHAYHKLSDDVPEDVKQRRLREVRAVRSEFRVHALRVRVR